MTEPILRREPVADGVVQLTLERPDKRNALSTALRSAIVAALAELASDESCRAVVLTGAGGVFCAGFDLDELAHAEDPAALFADADSYHHAVHEFPKPIVAAIEGYAVAGGCDLALMCDIRLAAPGARLGQPQVKAGIPAAFDLVRSVVADHVARELCYTGRLVDATEAERIGLVNHVVDDVVAAAHSLAAAIAAVPSAAATKRQAIAGQPDLFPSR